MIHPQRLIEIRDSQNATPEEQREMAMALLRFFAAAEISMSRTEQIARMKRDEARHQSASTLLNDWYDRYG